MGNTGKSIVLFTNTINIDLIEVKCNEFHKFSLVCIKKLQWNKLNSLSKQFTSVNKFVSCGVERVHAYCIPKLIFSHDYPVKVGDACYITVRNVVEFLRYIYNVMSTSLVIIFNIKNQAIALMSWYSYCIEC